MENKNIVSILIIIICIIVIYYIFSDKRSENYIDPTQLPIEAVTAMLGTLQSIVDSNGTLNMTTISTTNLTTKNLISAEPVFEIQNGTLANSFKYVAASKDAKVIRIGDGSGLRLNFVGKTATDPSILQIYDNVTQGVVVGGNLSVGTALYLGNKTNSTGAFLYPDGTDGALSIRNSANNNLGPLRVGDINSNGYISGKCTNTQGGFSLGYGTWITANAPATDDPYKLLFENSGNTVFRSKVGYEFRNEKDQRNIIINSQTSAVTINGPLTIGNGPLTIGNTTIRADGTIDNPGWTLENGGNLIFKKRYTGVFFPLDYVDATGNWRAWIKGGTNGDGPNNRIQTHYYNGNGSWQSNGSLP